MGTLLNSADQALHGGRQRLNDGEVADAVKFSDAQISYFGDVKNSPGLFSSVAFLKASHSNMSRH